MAADTSTVLGHSLAIVGGGFGGSLLALKLASSGVRPILIEASRFAGAGLAYGAASPEHLLNVPVQRMEVGLSPSFLEWLGDFPNETAAAIAESGDLAQAFVPRILFGRYLTERVEEALAAGRITRLRGEVTRLHKSAGHYELTLADGRLITANRVVLATGNLSPKAPDLASEDNQKLADSPLFVPDPWSGEAFAGLKPDAPVLLIGAGLTMADIALSLHTRGHNGAIFVMSRRGLLPLAHAAGGAWPAFLDMTDESQVFTPLALLRRIRFEVHTAVAQGVPWQRVLDAVRPAVAQIWAGWNRAQRTQFLRHLRPFWDVHRHRLAPRIAHVLQGLIKSGQLMPLSGRLKQFAGRGDYLNIAYAVRHRREIRNIKVQRVINCTGPRTDFASLGTPLFADMRQQGLIQPDRLGLGLETSDARVIDAHGQVSNSLFAIGGLTRPAWWEITAVPEITAQVSRLAQALSQDHSQPGTPTSTLSLAHDFLDLGAGI